MSIKELALIEKLESCIEIVSEGRVDNYQHFLIQTLQEAILKLTPRKNKVHSCDIPGCLACGNPEIDDPLEI